MFSLRLRSLIGVSSEGPLRCCICFLGGLPASGKLVSALSGGLPPNKGHMSKLRVCTRAQRRTRLFQFHRGAKLLFGIPFAPGAYRLKVRVRSTGSGQVRYDQSRPRVPRRSRTGTRCCTVGATLLYKRGEDTRRHTPTKAPPDRGLGKKSLPTPMPPPSPRRPESTYLPPC